MPKQIDRLNVAMRLFSSLKERVFNEFHFCAEDCYYVLIGPGFGESVFTLSQTHHLRRDAKVCILLFEPRKFLLELWPQSGDCTILLSAAEYWQLMALE